MSENSVPQMPRKKLTAIDLFSGCGGLSMGLVDAGFDILAAVEIDRKAQETYELNHPGVHLLKEDIRDLNPISLLNDLGLVRGQLDLLAGCPPCQGFSKLRTRNKSNSIFDDRNDLIADFLRFVCEIRPKSIMMENVPALINDQRFKGLCKVIRSIGYKFTVKILDAADYSVPQRRKRMILLASMVHSPNVAKPSPKKVTVREALSGVGAPSRSKDKLHALPERRSESVKRIISLIPKNGGSRSSLPEIYQLNCHRKSNGFSDVYGRMSWDSVAPTITSGCFNPSKGRFLHPSYNRNITLREAALLQGFPMSFKFDVKHGKESIALMIGNALPPPFISAHAKELANNLMEHRTENRANLEAGTRKP